MKRPHLMALWMAALAAFLGLAAANLIFGELNQDEGWYLYAGRLVSEGEAPYRDFAFTQGPLLPYIYAWAQPLVERAGLAGGRAFTAALAALGLLAAAGLASRLAPETWRREAALLAFTLAGVNVYQSYFTTLVKTYALCGLALASGFFVLALARDRRAWTLYALGGFLLSAAAATRISTGLALAVVGLCLIADRRRLGDGAWLAFGAGGAAGLALFYGPLVATSWEAYRELGLAYHSARHGGGLGSLLVYKAGFVSRVLQAYFVALVGGVVLLLVRAARGPAARGERDTLVVALWLTVAGITLLQAAAPFPYDDYQVPLFPLFAAGLAAASLRAVVDDLSARRTVLALVSAAFLASAAAAVSSPLNQSWMILGRDRIWWQQRDQPALLQLRAAADEIRTRAGDRGLLLTQDTYLAVEAGLRVPRGLEMGIFSYFPDWPDAKARACHVLNRAGLRDLLAATDAQVAALSEYSFVIAAPEVRKLEPAEEQELWRRVEQRYRPVGEFPSFGQGATRLRLLVRAEDAGP